MRLWVRLSLLISGLLVLVILATTTIAVIVYGQGGQRFPVAPEQGRLDTTSVADISYRLGALVAIVGLVGVTVGVIVSRTVSAPISRLAGAAHRIGEGDLDIRVKAGGSQELVELTHAFNKMVADLQRAEELRANLIADVSHELRTPLTVLEGNLRASLDHVYVLDEAMIADLYSQTRHLIHLVNDLRELSLADARQLPLKKEPIDLAALVDEVLRVFGPLAEDQGVNLAQQMPPLPPVTADAARIRQVLHNLLVNALRYTPQGDVTVVGTVTPDAITLAVQDTGIGLTAEQLAHVFDRFYRGDKSRSRDTGGTGLGLAIVKAIVEAHGGSVAAASSGPGQGSTFSLQLPRQ
jgi:signal transduction histidine kinase